MINITDAIIIALITSATSLITAKWNSDKKSKEEARNEAKRQQYQDDKDDYFDEKLKEIEQKLDEHNHYAEKFGEIKIAIIKIQKDIEFILKERSKNDGISKSTKKRTAKKK